MQAQARQEVVRAETAAAELDAQRQEKVLNTEVRKPADAEAYRQVTIANAERDAAIARAQAEAQQTTLTGNAEAEATKATGDAEAGVIQAKGLAEAAGIKARADALAENQDAVIAQIIAERYPEIVAAGAQAMANIDNMVVLNGGEGVEDLLAKAMTMGGAGLGIAQSLIASISTELVDRPRPRAARRQRFLTRSRKRARLRTCPRPPTSSSCCGTPGCG